MAEVLGAVSGTTGILSLAMELCKIVKTYTDDVTDAGDTLTDSERELKSLKEVLWRIETLSKSNTDQAIAEDADRCAQLNHETDWPNTANDPRQLLGSDI